MRRIDLIAPDPAPRKRWSQSAIDLSQYGIQSPFSEESPLDVAIANKSFSLRMKHSHNTLYASEQVIPPNSFVQIGPDLAMSCPELLFAEMATVLDLPKLLMLGHELCGEFSRDASNPLNGPVTYWLKPVTTRERIFAYLEQTRWLPGAALARRALELLSDNAWSPTESVVATMASLPIAECGFELSPCVMNRRIAATEALAPAAAASSRVPDILFGDAKVGINYDGAVHLDLDSVVGAAMELGRNPGSSATAVALDEVVKAVRAKAVDDIRRNRELAATGYVVFPVTKEDLYEEGGFDRVMIQVIEALEAFAHRDMGMHRSMMQSKFLSAKRQELIWSLLPGRHPDHVSYRKEAMPYLYQPSEVHEVIIGF